MRHLANFLRATGIAPFLSGRKYSRLEENLHDRRIALAPLEKNKQTNKLFLLFISKFTKNENLTIQPQYLPESPALYHAARNPGQHPSQSSEWIVTMYNLTLVLESERKKKVLFILFLSVYLWIVTLCSLTQVPSDQKEKRYYLVCFFLWVLWVFLKCFLFIFCMLDGEGLELSWKPLRIYFKDLHWTNMHIDTSFVLLPVLIECQRLHSAVRGRHDRQQRSGTLWDSIRAIKTKQDDNFTCSNLNFSRIG